MNEEKFFYEMPTVLETKREIDIIVKKGLASNKKKKTWIKYSALAATAAFAMLFVLAFSFPNYARQIPIIGGIFELYQQMTGWMTGELQEYAFAVNVVGEVDGMTITIQESTFDGQTVHFTYLIESEHPINSEMGFHSYQGYILGFDITNPRLQVDGREMHGLRGFAGGSGVLQRSAENKYIVVTSISFPYFRDDIQSAVIRFDLGEWNVSFPITKMESQVIPLNVTVTYDEFTVTISRVVFSSLGANIYFNYQVPSLYANDMFWDNLMENGEAFQVWMGFRVFDEWGHDHTEGLLRMFEMNSSGGYGWFRFEDSFQMGVQEITIIPYMTIEHYQVEDVELNEYDLIHFCDFLIESREIEFDSIVIPIHD